MRQDKLRQRMFLALRILSEPEAPRCPQSLPSETRSSDQSMRLDAQHAIAADDLPAIDDAAVVGDVRMLVHRAGRADVCWQCIDFIPGAEALGGGRLDDEVFLV